MGRHAKAYGPTRLFSAAYRAFVVFSATVSALSLGRLRVLFRFRRTTRLDHGNAIKDYEQILVTER